MTREKISDLILKYNDGVADDDDLLLIENLLEKGIIALDDLDDVKKFEEQIEKIDGPSPSLRLDDKFYEVLATEKKSSRRFSFDQLFTLNTFFTRLAFASVTFLIGLGVGYYVLKNNNRDTTEVQALSDEVKSLKEMMMLSLLEKESATERLKAVSMSHELDESSNAVTIALLKTLNKDENVNVRLAALDALKPYVNDSGIRKELIKSIAKQDSPLVQVALADLMASIQEKSSVKEFDKLLDDDKTPKEVKSRIRKSIQVLI